MFVSDFNRINTRILPGRYLSAVHVSAGDGEGIGSGEILETIRRDREGLDGIAIVGDGADPLSMADLFRLAKELRSSGLDVILVTSGCDPTNLDDLVGAGYVNFVSFDIDGGPEENLASCMDVCRDNGCGFSVTVRLGVPLMDESSMRGIAKASAGSRHFIVVSPKGDPSKGSVKKKDVDSLARSVSGLVRDLRVI